MQHRLWSFSSLLTFINTTSSLYICVFFADLLRKSLQVLNSSGDLLQKLRQLQRTEVLQRRGRVLQEEEEQEEVNVSQLYYIAAMVHIFIFHWICGRNVYVSAPSISISSWTKSLSDTWSLSSVNCWDLRQCEGVFELLCKWASDAHVHISQIKFTLNPSCSEHSKKNNTNNSLWNIFY